MPFKDYNKKIEYKRKWNKEYYSKNKESEKARIFKRRREIRDWIWEYKTNLECIKCGEDATACLDFHHLDEDQKDLSLGLAKQNGWGIGRIKKEIEKCIVLCSNCHRKLHAGLIK